MSAITYTTTWLPRLFTATEVARVLRVAALQVVDLCRSGDLAATMPARTWLIEPKAILDYLGTGRNVA